MSPAYYLVQITPHPTSGGTIIFKGTSGGCASAASTMSVSSLSSNISGVTAHYRNALGQQSARLRHSIRRYGLRHPKQFHRHAQLRSNRRQDSLTNR